MPVIKPMNKGFTLIELVVGISLFAIVLVLVTSLIIPQARRSVDPILQMRAAELAQSLINEIRARSFDENADRVNGLIRCNEDLVDDADEVNCSLAASFGSVGGATDEEDRDDFDDVDDYHNLNQSGGSILNSNGQNIVVAGTNLYEGYTASVNVTYAGDFYDNTQDIQNAKLITVTVTTPTGVNLVFATYRSNF